MRIGVFGLAFLILLIARIAGWITWSWWIIISPLIAGFMAGMLSLLFIFVIALVVETPTIRYKK